MRVGLIFVGGGASLLCYRAPSHLLARRGLAGLLSETMPCQERRYWVARVLVSVHEEGAVSRQMVKMWFTYMAPRRGLISGTENKDDAGEK